MKQLQKPTTPMISEQTDSLHFSLKISLIEKSEYPKIEYSIK